MFRSKSMKKKQQTDPKYLRERLETLRPQIMHMQQKNAEAIVDNKPMSLVLANSRKIDNEADRLEEQEKNLREEMIQLEKDFRHLNRCLTDPHMHDGTIKRLGEKRKEVNKRFGELSDEFLHLVKTMRLQEEIINSLSNQLREENIKPQAVPLDEYKPLYVDLPEPNRASLFADPSDVGLEGASNQRHGSANPGKKKKGVFRATSAPNTSVQAR
mmetsp:Transcript_2198/g.4943  ORF Transcript_2198/g.4943 Transcript_2198/m.4943 type:complete len:214 (-) Transcript_2198:73-714(-)